MPTSPSANIAGSQTTTFIDLSFLPAQPSKVARKRAADSFADIRPITHDVICGVAAARWSRVLLRAKA
jgi:hypothetical protein